TSTPQCCAWAALRFRCRTASRWRRLRSRPAKTSRRWRDELWEERPMPDVTMPKLSDTMEEGTILEWKKKDGDEVHKGEVLAEVEADKATFDLEAEDDGVLSITVEKGVPAKIGAPIATIGPAGSAPAKAPKADGKKPKKAKAEAPTAEAEPAAEAESTEGPDDDAAPVAEAAPAEIASATEPEPSPAKADGAAVKASPLAKRLAAELGLDLTGVKGSG